MGQINMKTFTVTMAQIETRVWQLNVSAENSGAAEDEFYKLWDDGQLADTEGRSVHVEEFINQVDEVIT